MLHSKQLDQLLPALAKAQAAFPAIPKNHTATIYTKRGSYDFAYADLGSILQAVTPALRAEGLMFIWGLQASGTGGVRVGTRLVHVSSGQWIGSAIDLDLPDTMQALGSAITYVRRYSVVGLLALVAEDDDDGSAASGQLIQRRAVAASTNGHAPEVDVITGTGRPEAPEPPSPPAMVPTDAGLPCGGALIADLTPPQLHMLVSKVGFRMLAEPTYAPLLAALQAERARRLEQGRKYAKPNGEG